MSCAAQSRQSALVSRCIFATSSRLSTHTAVTLIACAGSRSRKAGDEPRHVLADAVQTAANAWREHRPDTPASELVGQAFDLLAVGLNYPAAATRELATA